MYSQGTRRPLSAVASRSLLALRGSSTKQTVDNTEICLPLPSPPPLLPPSPSSRCGNWRVADCRACQSTGLHFCDSGGPVLSALQKYSNLGYFDLFPFMGEGYSPSTRSNYSVCRGDFLSPLFLLLPLLLPNPANHCFLSVVSRHVKAGRPSD